MGGRIDLREVCGSDHAGLKEGLKVGAMPPRALGAIPGYRRKTGALCSSTSASEL
jgi:hypothetical protein